MRRPGALWILLSIELLDELVFGAREAAWPLIRNELNLTYVDIGLLLALPSIFSAVLEPSFGLLADAGRRRTVVLAGGVAFAAGMIGVVVAPGFAVLLAAFVVMYPSSGAFVSLSQATLMDMQPEQRDTNMARWTLAGSIGVVTGPVAVAASEALGWGWRAIMVGLACSSLLLVAWARRLPFAAASEGASLTDALRGLASALRRVEVARWLTLLECSDLMLDVLLGYLALYFIDVAHTSPSTAALGVATWTGAGLVGDALLIPLLRRVSGLRYLRASALAVAIAYPALLLVPSVATKFVLLALLGLLNAGWYAIPQARLFAELPGRSGTAVALSSVAGLIGGLVPLALGALAEALGLGAALWALMLGPLALLVGLPRREPEAYGSDEEAATSWR